MNRHTVLGAMIALSLVHAATALAQPTFLITQGSTLYRYQPGGSVASFPISDVISGLTTVPAGMAVGNFNGGAVGGDAIAVGSGSVYRVDDPLGSPHLTYIGAAGGPNASPVFANGHLYGIGGDPGPGSIFVEWDLTTFAETLREPTGVYGGPGGMVHESGNDFLYAEFNTRTLWRYTIGSFTSTSVAPLPAFDYVGLEDCGGTVYASFAFTGTNDFVFGTLNTSSGAFNQILRLDDYGVGITGLTWVVPTPGSAALFGAGLFVAVRRRRKTR